MVFIWWQTHNKNYLDVNFNETNEKMYKKAILLTISDLIYTVKRKEYIENVHIIIRPVWVIKK